MHHHQASAWHPVRLSCKQNRNADAPSILNIGIRYIPVLLLTTCACSFMQAVHQCGLQSNHLSKRVAAVPEASRLTWQHCPCSSAPSLLLTTGLWLLTRHGASAGLWHWVVLVITPARHSQKHSTFHRPVGRYTQLAAHCA